MTYEELYAAWLAFRRHKKPSRAIDEFAYYIEKNLQTLACDIEKRTYCHGAYDMVVVCEKKRRDLAVASVRDRVVHRLVYDELVRAYNPVFDPDVWSCRPGKGLYGCLNRVKALLCRYPGAYVWRTDITKFFDHVDHATLNNCLAQRTHEPHILWLCEQIIASFCKEPDVGIPIGNLTSQVFANSYLHELDRHIRHVVEPLAYVRYGDDMVVWACNRQEILRYRERLTAFLSDVLKMTTNPRNDCIVRSYQGLHFLGHVVTPSYIVVDRHTTKSALQKSCWRSIASYTSLRLAVTPKKQLSWQLLDELEEQGLI
ncbi:hypothetical protein EOM33_03580 [Candidatus Saccharibacteria bacterium]|nr:hypothetical protein [Candidatus Saccharibacteria bacterium]